MMRKGLWAGLVALAVAVCGEPAAAATGPKPLFASRDVIHLTIKGPVGSLAQGQRDTEKSVPGSLTVQGASPETLAISLSPRGITRRRKEVCGFPPLRVEFTEKPAATSLFKGQKRLKLVTHCRAVASFQQYVLLEYAVYRMYNVLTPASFNVRLASVDYVDEAGRPITSRLAFFIEDADDVADRNGLLRVRTKERVPVAQLSARDAGRYVMFEYMISNLDWAMTAGPAGEECCHNARLMAAEGATGAIIPVPYDFDYSGVVDAPYATTPAEIPLANVRIRRYRGHCRYNAEAQAAAAELLARRAAMLAVYDELPQLEPRTRQKAIDYLGGFFSQVGSPADIAKVQERCIG